MERQRLLKEAQRRALELQTAAEIARDTTSTLTLDLLLDRMVNCCANASIITMLRSSLLDDTQYLQQSFKNQSGEQVRI